VVVTILGMFLGWLGVQVKWIHDRHESLKWIRSQPQYNSSTEKFGGTGRNDDRKLGRPPWSIRILGEPGMQRILFYAASDSEMNNFDFHPEIRQLFPEAVIGTYGPEMTEKESGEKELSKILRPTQPTQ